MNIKKIIKYFIPFYCTFTDCLTSKIHYITYIKYIKFKLCESIFGHCKLYYPIHKTCTVANPRKVYVGINSIVMRMGNYIQGAGTVMFGNYVRTWPNVGILSANHDLYNQNIYNVKPIIIGDYCWIGMNSIVTAGVELGPRTIVGVGSIVTKSFPDGFCVIAGNPAKVIKNLEKEKFVPWHYKHEYYGFIPKRYFEKKRKKYLDI